MSKVAKVFVIHGPNLGLLGERKPEIYGKYTLDDINSELEFLAKQADIEIDFLQSDSEGEIVSKVGQAKNKYDVIIINPAGYTHTSIAIRDAVEAAGIDTIEVHLSNIYNREEFRNKSLIAPVCVGQVSGFGKNSYVLAFQAALEIIKSASL
ncbi:MAG: type II 3-dehydroquinate dehydratase [Candidatus Saelkia tenebricola]|nr:type II 3-dehydroquinate dehydratase [Candidatus Saelkia tenebricola]